MEEVDSISVAVSGIDINKVEPLDNRRIVAFINHFLCTSATFLNEFASKCETKLEELQVKIHRVESRLQILECKLASIPQSTLPSATAISNPTSQPEKNTSQASTVSISASENQFKQIPQPPRLPQTPEQSEDKTVDEDKASIPDSEEGFQGQCSETGSIPGSDAEKSANKPNPRDDPRYSKYFKMCAVGVPVPAIKIKMMTEGVDPSILDS